MLALFTEFHVFPRLSSRFLFSIFLSMFSFRYSSSLHCLLSYISCNLYGYFWSSSKCWQPLLIHFHLSLSTSFLSPAKSRFFMGEQTSLITRFAEPSTTTCSWPSSAAAALPPSSTFSRPAQVGLLWKPSLLPVCSYLDTNLPSQEYQK